jgi:glycosyltransferase involved in cell wall biosynthesis
VAYEAQGNGECMIEGKTGTIVPRGNPEAFCAALLNLAGEDAAVRRQRSQRAMSHARENFDETRQVDTYLQLFHKLLENRAS